MLVSVLEVTRLAAWKLASVGVWQTSPVMVLTAFNWTLKGEASWQQRSSCSHGSNILCYTFHGIYVNRANICELAASIGINQHKLHGLPQSWI